MAPINVGLMLINLIITMLCTCACGQYITKGSLVFLIDDTKSMTDDIEQVKNGSIQIFQTVLESKDSQIKDYVVVTFNDPYATFRVRTENSTELKDVLSNLTVTKGNADCPEYAILGIEYALNYSLPFSYIYVFTDASAKDHENYDRIKRISQQKQSQIVFALTGDCHGARNTSEYQIYHRIAEDTSGQVFHIDKNEVKDILKYVKETITGKRNLIASLKFKPDMNKQHKQTFNITVDSKTESLTIAVSGMQPTIAVMGPDGIISIIKIIVNTTETKIAKLSAPKPGVYQVTVSSISNASVVVTGKSNVYFQHGFSPYQPTSIKDTATRPPADGSTFLSIKLFGMGVILESVKILNMDNTVITELPLEMINDKEQLYTTKEFNPPNNMFRIEVVGYDVADNTAPVIRRAQTSIERSSKEDEDRVPPTIDRPDTTSIDRLVGDNASLSCIAHGYPKPDIEWKFKGSDSIEAPINTRLINGTSVLLPRLQINEEGAYTCVASNVAGADNLTYAVNLFAAPIIENMYTSKTFVAVIGDLALRIQCNATGRPQPAIAWYRNGSLISFDAVRYDMGEDGTLIIKNITHSSQGIYVCHAENKLGNDSITYSVEVNEYPQRNLHQHKTPNVPIEVDAIYHVECPIPHKNTDLIRWFKEGRVIVTTGELNFTSFTSEDAGFYTCRVSDDFKSQSAHVNIIVGSKPVFTDQKVDEEIHDLNTKLDCEAAGYPAPNIVWRYNGVEMLLPNITFTIKKDVRLGKYECVLSNTYGHINRTFNIKPEGCVLAVDRDFYSIYQPLMASVSGQKWPLYNVMNGYMVIPKADQIHLYCPNGFSNIPTKLNHTYATCIAEGDRGILNVMGQMRNYSKIECNNVTFPKTHSKRKKCLGKNILKTIGFKPNGEYHSVYEVCTSKIDNSTLYTTYLLQPGLINILRDVSEMNANTHLSANTLIDCADGTNGKNHISNQWCFINRQLVNYQDLHPNVPAVTSYHPWNLVPLWSSCQSNNWDEVERRIRLLVQASNRGMVVHTGAAGVLKLSGDSTICNKYNQSVRQYLWKVVEDHSILSSLAIIQVNDPSLLSGIEVAPYVLCADICNRTVWMNNPDWHDVTKGFVYCCDITEFAKVIKKLYNADFKFKGNIRNILKDVDTSI